jgi:hypothetical protein
MKKVLRKVYSKNGSPSLIFNIPLDIAKNLGFVRGDYLTAYQSGSKMIIEKLNIEGGSENAK